MLKHSCKKIDAFYGFTENRGVLKGFVVLRGRPTHMSGLQLQPHFRNFNLYGAGLNFDFNFEGVSHVTQIGKHPYKDIRRDLFKERSLSSFFGPSTKKRKHAS